MLDSTDEHLAITEDADRELPDTFGIMQPLEAFALEKIMAPSLSAK